MSDLSSQLLKDKKEQILSLWEKRCVKEVTSAETTPRLALRNSIPIYLDHLSEALKTNKKMDFRSVFARDAESTRIGKLHGADRASNRSYELTEVIFEYHILREVIFQALEADDAISQEQRDIILDSIEQAVNDAAVEFSEVHLDIQQSFVNTLTHDLKNPISSAKLNAQILLRRGDLTDAGIKSASSIVENMNRLERMILDLLDSSRVRAGEGMMLTFSECDLDTVVRQVADEMSVLHGSRFKVISDGPMRGTWGCDGIRRALENLLGNAVKYGGTETPITTTLSHETGLAKLTVHNTGTPIPENELSSVFKMYTRSKSAEKSTETGWGLGLTVVKGVVEAHGGSVQVESNAGSGTTFTLILPVQSAVTKDPGINS